MSDDLTHDRLREIIDYDCECGLWRYKQSGGSYGKYPDWFYGTYHPKGYLRIWIYGKQYLSGRLAWFWQTGFWPSPEIDHIDRVKDHDRIVNLREATSSQNSANSRSVRNEIGFRGVYKNRRRYCAHIKTNGRIYYLGTFNTALEASRAYDKKASEMFGEFALLNHPL